MAFFLNEGPLRRRIDRAIALKELGALADSEEFWAELLEYMQRRILPSLGRRVSRQVQAVIDPRDALHETCIELKSMLETEGCVFASSSRFLSLVWSIARFRLISQARAVSTQKRGGGNVTSMTDLIQPWAEAEKPEIDLDHQAIAKSVGMKIAHQLGINVNATVAANG